MRYEQLSVVRNEKLCEGHFVLELVSNKPLPNIKAGQFLNLRCSTNDHNSLMRPFSILSVDESSETLSVFVKILGRLTAELSEAQPGTQLNCLFPLGNGFEYIDSWKKVALVGGGVGIAPLLYLAEQLNNRNTGVSIDVFVGGRNENDLAMELLESYEFPMHFATDDGKRGYRGTVVDLFSENMKIYDVVYTCGPNPMMAALKMKLSLDTPAYASLEEYMACGVGACLGCVARIKEGDSICNKPICKDGPVFNLHQVEF